MNGSQFYFDWDAAKAHTNAAKHGVSFERATTVFRDPGAVSIFDDEHSKEEDRWVTIGQDSTGVPLVIVHTFDAERAHVYRVRLISARKATKRETAQYHAGQL